MGGALLPTEHQEEFHRQSSAGATLKSTLPKQGRDALEVYFKKKKKKKLLGSYVEKTC